MCGCATNQAVKVQGTKKIAAGDKAAAQPPKAAQLPGQAALNTKQNRASKDTSAKQSSVSKESRPKEPQQQKPLQNMNQQSQQYLASEIKRRSDRLRLGESKKSSESRVRVKDLGRRPVQIPEKYVKLDEDVVQQLYVKPLLKKKQIPDVVI